MHPGFVHLYEKWGTTLQQKCFSRAQPQGKEAHVGGGDGVWGSKLEGCLL